MNEADGELMGSTVLLHVQVQYYQGRNKGAQMTLKGGFDSL